MRRSALPADVAEASDVPLAERIQRLEKEMRAHAKRLEFEEAAELRNKIRELHL
jgi:excinuclease UvrABC helicase subunit UvrB